MPRLIDVDNLAEYKFASDFIIPTEWQQGWNDAFDTVINEVPTVDAEPVVRCKDCKFFDHSDFGKGEEYWCKLFIKIEDSVYCHRVTEDDFCAWGERREDGKTD